MGIFAGVVVEIVVGDVFAAGVVVEFVVGDFFWVRSGDRCLGFLPRMWWASLLGLCSWLVL